MSKKMRRAACEFCDEVFYTRASRGTRFCSLTCSGASRRVRHPATCLACGSEFDARVDSAGRYCSRACASPRIRMAGARHPGYTGGLHRDREGRLRIMCRDGTQMFFYRGVMAAEIGRLLESHEIVHHKNGDPSDDRIENLQIVTRSEHIAIHRNELQGAAA